MAEFDAEVSGGGGIGEGADSSAQMPGESFDDYIARLKKMGLYGGDIANQPQIGADSIGRPGASWGSTSGIGAGMAGTSQGTTSGIGTGVGGAYGSEQKWDNSPPSRSASGGASAGGFMPAGNHLTALMGQGGVTDSGGGSSMPGYVPKAELPPTDGMFARNMLDALFSLRPEYVKSAYRNQPNPYSVDPSVYNNAMPARNYLDQLLRSRGGR